MGVIRRADFDAAPRDAFVLDLGDVERQGEHLRRLAGEHAERVVAEAQAERTRLITGAREEGFAAGKAEGYQVGLAEGAAAGREAAHAEWRDRLDALAGGWERALAAFEAQRSDALLAARQDSLALALRLAERIVRDRIRWDAGLAERQVRAAVEAIGEATRVTILVHPEDREPVERMLRGTARSLHGSPHADLVDDASVGRGGCVVRTPEGGVVDARLDEQLDRLISTLRPSAAPSPPPSPAPSPAADERDGLSADTAATDPDEAGDEP